MNENQNSKSEVKPKFKPYARRAAGYADFNKNRWRNYNSRKGLSESRARLFAPQASLRQYAKPYIRRSASSENVNDTRQPHPTQDPDFITKLKNSVKREIDSALDAALKPKMDEIQNTIRQSIMSNINSYIDVKLRYNVEQRLGLMFNNDEITTRGANAFSISEDSITGGKSFMFKYQGQPVAKITEDGRLYCKFLYVGGVSILELINTVFKNFEQIGDLYVRHQELKDGTFELNVEDIITNTLEANAVVVSDSLTATNGTIQDLTVLKQETIQSDEETPLTITNSNDNSTCSMTIGNQKITGDKTNNKLILNDVASIYKDQWGLKYFESNAIYNDFFSNGGGMLIRIGKNYGVNNCASLQWYHVGDGNASNRLELMFHSSNWLLQLYKDAIKFNTANFTQLNSLSSTVSHKIGYQESNNGCFEIAYNYASNVDDRYTVMGNQGYPAIKFWKDKVELLLPLYYNNTLVDFAHIAYTNVSNTFTASQNITGALNVINSNATSDGNEYAYIRVGEDSSTNNIELRYQRNTHYRSGSDIGIKIFGTDRLKLMPYQIQIVNVEHGLRVANELDVSGYIWTRELQVRNYNMTEGGDLNLPFGNATNSNDYANFIYHYSATLANSYLKMGIKGYENVEIRNDRINMTSPLNVNTTNIDQPLNVAMTGSRSWNQAAMFLNSGMTSGQNLNLTFGKANEYKNSGYLNFNWYANQSNSNFISLAFPGSDHTFRVYPNKIDVNDTLIGIGSNLAQAVFQVIYPIGSIYISAKDPGNLYVYDTTGHGQWVYRFTLYGCVFELLNGYMIRGAKASYNLTTGAIDWQKAPGSMVGTDSVRMYESNMPEHSHSCAHVNNNVRTPGSGDNWNCHLSNGVGNTSGYNTPTQTTGSSYAVHDNIPYSMTLIIAKRIA